ncbi:MAG: hypothetical protein K9L24_03445 [Spirochaetia bacterium]|nr:hypothetical protein [Spirochaetia bacterium]MCF7945888.1 hypothetical protein [Spirochaetia bacterium]
MSRNIERSEVVYPRYNQDGQKFKELLYKAYFLNRFDYQSLELDYKNLRFYSSQAGIDKISLCLSLDFLNEGAGAKYSNGAFSTRRNGRYFFIDVHGEYINPEVNILKQVEEIVYFLMRKNWFKIPIEKIEFSCPDGEYLNCDSYDFVVENETDFVQIIMDNIKLSTLEIKHDLSIPVFKYLDEKEFTVVGDTTYYSKDYTYSQKSKKRKKSFLCIYDKSRQVREVKKQTIDDEITRIEFRLFGYYLKKVGGIAILDGLFQDVYNSVKPVIVKKLKRLKINFQCLYRVINNGDLKNILTMTIAFDGDRENEKNEYVHKCNNSVFSVVDFIVVFWGSLNVFEKIFYLIKTSMFSSFRTECLQRPP